MNRSVRVWDAPTRLFHWLMVACFVGLVVSGNMGGSAMEWHFKLGYSMLSLVLFRLVWGFVGGYWSRFSSFFFTPKEIIGYLQGKPTSLVAVGHNPLGSLSVYALLLFLIAQITSGLMSDDEIASMGPLVQHVSSSVVGYATWYHKDVGKLILIGLVVVHLAAIISYFFIKKENLVKPMVMGDKLIDFECPASSDNSIDRLKSLAIFTSAVAVVFSLVNWLG